MAAGPTVLVSAKFTVISPEAVAATLYGPPACPFAVNAVAVATPFTSVAAFVVPGLLADKPLAPVFAGAVNVTITPWMGLLLLSFTVTPSAVPNACVTCADCGVVFAFAVIWVAAPVVLVSAKFSVVSPVAVAATLYGPPAC